MECSYGLDPDDEVVAELDVMVSNELQALGSQLVMLQQPLRPNWRAYEADQQGGSRALCGWRVRQQHQSAA
jgi:hypothetical protein